MGQHLVVGSIEQRFVATRFTDAAAQVVRNHQGGHAAKETEGAGVGANPVGQALSQGGLGVGVVGSAQDGHEDLRLAQLTGSAVNDRDGWSGVIDKQLFAGAMRLPHHQFEMRLPLLVMKTELGIAVTVIRVRGPILFPEQQAGHPFFFQLGVDGRKVRQGAARISLTSAGVGSFGPQPLG